jgi:4-hydroxybenzoate polyprenyltransferase
MYNARPLRLSRKPVASIAVLGLCYGLLPLVYGFTQHGGGLTRALVIVGGLWFLQRVSTSIMKDFKDAKGDKLFGKKTFYLVYGRRAIAWVSNSFSLVAYIGIIAFLLYNFSLSVLSITLCAVASAAAVRNIIIRLRLFTVPDEKTLAGIFSKSFIYQNQFDAIILLCLILL